MAHMKHLTEDELAYPLRWPIGRPRTKDDDREAARFGSRTSQGMREVTVTEAIDRVFDQLERMDAEHIVISTDLNAGSRRDPTDPGVAVYFNLRSNGKLSDQHALACDKWDRLADNIAAIACHVDALRGQLRWGVALDAAQAFAGFKALPAMPAAKPWWEVLGFMRRPAGPQEVKDAFRTLSMKHHPDRGGNPNRMAEISAAYSTGLAEVSQ